ncbi:hypothetical protein R3P38DRAFT_3177208 [Favolaschia claudopus]|uniref:Uncharacterized protein n=1 Tax=Favolaschia claudopus TaxID=2862362 RepID=A0AAW0D0U2_9AGAR
MTHLAYRGGAFRVNSSPHHADSRMKLLNFSRLVASMQIHHWYVQLRAGSGDATLECVEAVVSQLTLAFGRICTTINHGEISAGRTLVLLPPLFFFAPHSPSKQATGNVLIVNPRRRRSLLPRKVAVKVNDDVAEKRLRRVVLERERREEQEHCNQEIPVALTPEAATAQGMEIAGAVEEALEEIKDVTCNSRNGKIFRSRLLGISLASEDDEALSAEDKQIARNWELAVKFALEQAGELDRQQWLREWREQEKEERRWEENERRWWATREYADDLPSGTEYWVAIPKSLKLYDATLWIREGRGPYDTLVPTDLFRGERLVEFNYLIHSKVFASFSYDYGCPFRSCSYGENYDSTRQTFGAAAIEKHHWVNAEQIESKWAELSDGRKLHLKEMGPGRRHDALDSLWLKSSAWQGHTIVGGPLPSTRTRVNVETDSTNNVVVGHLGRLEEIDEDYLLGLKSVENGDDDEEDQCPFVPLRAKL